MAKAKTIKKQVGITILCGTYETPEPRERKAIEVDESGLAYHPLELTDGPMEPVKLYSVTHLKSGFAFGGKHTGWHFTSAKDAESFIKSVSRMADWKNAGKDELNTPELAKQIYLVARTYI